eukprot:153426_1
MWKQKGRYIIVDNGSASIKAGFGGDDAPRAIFPTVCGNLKPEISINKSSAKHIYVGDEVHAKREILQSRRPIQQGIVTNWNDMEHVWRHTFGAELRIDTGSFGVFMTEPPLNPKANRERMTQIMFETFYFGGCYIGNSAVLSLYASGRVTGIVCECGGEKTHIVPIYEGHYLPHATLKMDLGGDQLTQYLIRLLNARRYVFPTNTEQQDIARDIKEKLCSVALDYEQTLQQIEVQKYALPDGSIIEIKSEAIQVPEALFNPNLIFEPSTHPKMENMDFRTTLIDGYIKAYYKRHLHRDTFDLLCKYTAPIEHHQGMHELIYKSWMKCDIDIRHALHRNIVLSGGSTMFTGIAQRLEQSIPEYMRTYASGNGLEIAMDRNIKYIGKTTNSVRVICPPERKYSAWIGGSILSSLSTSDDMWITRDEYNDSGPSIVHRKCNN